MSNIAVTDLEVGMSIDLEDDIWANNVTKHDVYEFENALVESVNMITVNIDNKDVDIYLVNFLCGGGENLVSFPAKHVLTLGE